VTVTDHGPALATDPARQQTRPNYAAARWRALGTYVSLVVADEGQLATARSQCEQLLDTVDQACSRFRADSDLVRANRSAGEWVRVNPLLARAVSVAMDAAETTDGLVDPTLGGQLRDLGYDRDLAEIHAAESSPASRPTRPLVAPRLVSASPALPDGWREIGVDPDGGLRVPAGVSLDLGATGKAFAADLIAAAVPATAGTALVISLGGDVAIGQFGGDVHPWRIAVAERPADTDGPEAELVVLEEGALATSSTLARRWRRGDTEVHHLLDPRTGRPVPPFWRTVSVCAASCVEANAASTAAIVLGADAVDRLQRNDLAGRLVDADGRVTRVAGWPDPNGGQNR
jgi:thiamine biosynthesis lipoprotein